MFFLSRKGLFFALTGEPPERIMTMNALKIRILIFAANLFFLSLLSQSSHANQNGSLQGIWRAVLKSPGGELPFIISLLENENGSLAGFVINGDEKAPFTSISVINDSLILSFEHYDSSLRMAIREGGISLEGQWVKRGAVIMSIMALKDSVERFPLPPKGNDRKTPLEDISGSWKVLFQSQRGTTPATGIFRQSERRVTGTFLTPAGDYRFLEGVYANGILKLSCFNGSNAYLFVAEADTEGRLSGDYYSGSSSHSLWTAERGQGNLPDAYSMTKAKDSQKVFEFEFPDLTGKTISNRDERFSGKVLILNVYGTWCPNCNDEAPLLTELYGKYHERGLEIVGLANEVSDDFKRNREMVERFIKRYHIPWIQLIVGRADKEKTAEALNDLSGIAAYPTTIFVDRSGRIRKIHTGFSGPATGKYYEELKTEFIRIIEEML